MILFLCSSSEAAPGSAAGVGEAAGGEPDSSAADLRSEESD